MTLGAYDYISNYISSTTTVTDLPLDIVGSFAASQHATVSTVNEFLYDVTSGSPAGYIQMDFTGPFASAADCIAEVTVDPYPSGSPITCGTYQPPSYISLGGGQGNVHYIFDLNGMGGTIQFGNSNGTIVVVTTYANAGTVTSSMQVSTNIFP